MNMMFQDGEFKLRGKMVDVAGMTLPVAEGYKVGVRGGYVTVDGAAVPGFPDRNIKIMVAGADSVVETEGSITAAGQEESDAEIIERLDENLLELFEERAAIMEFDAGLGRNHAECLALLGVLYRHPSVLTGVIAIEIDEQGQRRWMLTSDTSAVTDLAVLRKAEVADVLREHLDGIAAMTPSDKL